MTPDGSRDSWLLAIAKVGYLVNPFFVYNQLPPRPAQALLLARQKSKFGNILLIRTGPRNSCIPRFLQAMDGAKPHPEAEIGVRGVQGGFQKSDR